MSGKAIHGFTLAELLICLMIVGEIATFTIPKIIVSQQNQRFNTIAKENIGMLMTAYQQHMYKGQLSSATKFSSLTQYMNYVAFDTVTPLDGTQGSLPSAGTSCANYACISLHNGSKIIWDPSESFGGTYSTSVISFFMDPDGKITDGTANGAGHAAALFLYYNGRIVDEGNIIAGSASSTYGWSRSPSSVPPWFSW